MGGCGRPAGPGAAPSACAVCRVTAGGSGSVACAASAAPAPAPDPAPAPVPGGSRASETPAPVGRKRATRFRGDASLARFPPTSGTCTRRAGDGFASERRPAGGLGWRAFAGGDGDTCGAVASRRARSRRSSGPSSESPDSYMPTGPGAAAAPRPAVDSSSELGAAAAAAASAALSSRSRAYAAHRCLTMSSGW